MCYLEVGALFVTHLCVIATLQVADACPMAHRSEIIFPLTTTRQHVPVQPLPFVCAARLLLPATTCCWRDRKGNRTSPGHLVTRETTEFLPTMHTNTFHAIIKRGRRQECARTTIVIYNNTHKYMYLLAPEYDLRSNRKCAYK